MMTGAALLFVTRTVSTGIGDDSGELPENSSPSIRFSTRIRSRYGMSARMERRRSAPRSVLNCVCVIHRAATGFCSTRETEDDTPASEEAPFGHAANTSIASTSAPAPSGMASAVIPFRPTADPGSFSWSISSRTSRAKVV